MNDQWPRWEVFKQDSDKRPHQAVGSVHAGDPDHALLTARNVFVRRPSALSLWLVREQDILSATPQQLQGSGEPATGSGSGRPELYHIGIKASHKRSLTFVDLVATVQAASPDDALRQACALYPGALAWWVFADAAVVRSDDSAETVESWFAPALDKTYKQQQFYGTIGKHIGELKRAGKIPAAGPRSEVGSESGSKTPSPATPAEAAPDTAEPRAGEVRA